MMTKTIQIDGKEVKFKASAAIPRLYRIKFGRDILLDLKRLEKSAKKVKSGEQEEFEVTDLEVFENVAYMFAKHAAPDEVPQTIDEWLEGFNTFSIYEVLPEILELWGVDTQTMVDAKKKVNRLTVK